MTDNVAALQERLAATQAQLQQFLADAKQNQKAMRRVQQQELELLQAASLSAAVESTKLERTTPPVQLLTLQNG